MKRINQLFLIVFLLYAFGCKDQSKRQLNINDSDYNPIVANSVERDLADIKEEGILKALVVYSSTSYFLYKGQAMGFEYELLQWLAKDLDLELEVVVSKDLDAEFEVLNRGDVDLIAHGMTVTNQRKWEVDFTEYLFLTRQVLVQKKPDNYRKLSWKNIDKALIQDPIELIGDTISIRRNSAYYERLQSLSNEIGGHINIDTLDSRLSTGEIIDLVANGKIKYTIADENLAKINASDKPILNIEVPISLSQRIAWVTRKKSRDFRNLVNDWIREKRKTTRFQVIFNKYFKNKRAFKRRIKSDYYSLSNNQISKYDGLIKTYAQNIGWDWRLLASQIYQESKFETGSTSWAGAMGLMQIMPATAKSLGITNPSDPNESIKGGTKYLAQMYEQFAHISDNTERIKFALASYNCGLGHVLDAQRLTKVNGLNPNIWDANVASMLLALSKPKNYNKSMIKYGYVRGSEPVNYVTQIFERYRHYKRFIAME
ncbi:transporter substrate-binding domain-containing protein [Hyunsoonleella sp. SJ7]|uniref:Transporter substrate-binding domain-containing protein n=1 Tax=Hyunsoonleella aquatilis TaxID=2762758 RepID=A0A923KKV5_9FLAO|nr:transporter substrate-binding domain-containing protein [Hyunsoonleella aquatilis]MBC3758887.1 transporter substrate-binding domain-containing protein [Hyunsoonleella aquatilis]